MFVYLISTNIPTNIGPVITKDTYASSEYAGTQVAQVMECPPPPSCNLIVMELLEQSPGHLNLNEIPRYINNII